MKFYPIILIIYYLIIYVSAYIDPSTTNPLLVKKFEYKLSFKGPHLAFKDGTVPFWTFGGSKVLLFEKISSLFIIY
jgi:mannose-binding lectin 1